MKRTYYILVVLMLTFFTSCDKSKNPYVDKEVINQLTKSLNPEVENVAIIFKNDVYFLEDVTKEGKRITNTPNSYKSYIRMSHDHKLFAYLNYAKEIEIVNASGQLITKLSQYNKVKSFDWSADDKTLYILNGDEMVYYGPSLNLPEITYNGIILGSSMDVIWASVSMKGDFAYIIHGFNFFMGDKYKLIIKPANKGADIVYEDNSTTYKMSYCSFSSNKQDLVLGYSDDPYQQGRVNEVYIFTDLRKNGDYAFGSYSGICTPTFNEEKSFFVGGYADEATNTATLKAIGVNGQRDKNKINSLYINPIDLLYTDWK